MIDSVLSVFAELMRNNIWFAPFLAFLAGVFTSFTPCCLSSIPLIIGYVGGTGEKDTKKAFLFSLIFSTGSALTFVVMGLIAASAGVLLGHASSLWHIILAVLMILMALQTWEIINIVPSSTLMAKNTKRGYVGAFIMGIFGGIFSSPCSTPVLVVLLALVADSGNLLWGMLLMLLYGFGNSTLIMIAGTSLGFVQNIKANKKYHTVATVLKTLTGFVILFIGFYILWNVF